MNDVVIVTGGFSGIGLAISALLLENGYTVYSTYNNKTEGEVDSIKCRLKSDNLHSIKLDITSAEDCELVMDNIINENNGVYALINNAGITEDSLFRKMTHAQWTNVLVTNLLSIFNTTQPVFNSMVSNNKGRIINISSVNAIKGQFGQCNYSASKAGIIAFSKSLAMEGARNNITVNTIAPGYTETGMMASIPENILDSIKASVPLGRLIKPVEVASAVLFLLSEHAAAITGETVSVNGGMVMS
jgi:acetoacetyl-CoA reductase